MAWFCAGALGWERMGRFGGVWGAAAGKKRQAGMEPSSREREGSGKAVGLFCAGVHEDFGSDCWSWGIPGHFGALSGFELRRRAGIVARRGPLRRGDDSGEAGRRLVEAHGESSVLPGAVRAWDHFCASREVKCGFLAWNRGNFFYFSSLGEVRAARSSIRTWCGRVVCPFANWTST